MKTIIFRKPPLFRRFVAFLVDLMILNLILFPFDWFFNKYLPTDVPYNVLSDLVSIYFIEILLGFVFYFLIFILYFSMFEFILGKTPGKGIWGIKVIQLESSRNFWRFLVRNLQVFFLIPFWVIDFLFIFSKKRNRLLERISGTTVVVG